MTSRRRDMVNNYNYRQDKWTMSRMPDMPDKDWRRYRQWVDGYAMALGGYPSGRATKMLLRRLRRRLQKPAKKRSEELLI